MANIKTVGIKDFRENLSGHLQDARRGTKILVSDRNTVIAELRGPTSGRSVPEVDDPIVGEWVRTGVVVPPSARRTPLPVSPVRLKDGPARRLLKQSRYETRE